MKKIRVPRLSRGGKTARNLLLALLLACAIWAQCGCPLPTAEMEFRRLGRENLLPRSELLWRRHGVSEVLVGRAEGRWVTGYLDEGGRSGCVLECGPLNDGPSPVPLTQLLDGPGETGGTVAGNAMLFLLVPAEAARAEVRVTGRSDTAVVAHGGAGRTETFAGEPQGNGVFFFWMGWGEPDSMGGSSTYSSALPGLPYTLNLYREDEALLLRQEGTIPEPW